MRLLEQPDGRVLWQEKGELRWPGSEPLPVQRTLYVVPRAAQEPAPARTTARTSARGW